MVAVVRSVAPVAPEALEWRVPNESPAVDHVGLSLEAQNLK